MLKWGIENIYKRWVYHGESLHVTSVEEPEMNENNVHDGNDEVAACEILFDMYRGENLGETIEAITRNSNEVLEKPNEEPLKKF